MNYSKISKHSEKECTHKQAISRKHSSALLSLLCLFGFWFSMFFAVCSAVGFISVQCSSKNAELRLTALVGLFC